MRPCTVSSFRPRFRMVSIMPGIEARAPDRTDTRTGCSASPKRLPTAFSTRASASATCFFRRGGEEWWAGGHVTPEAGHLGEVRALAAEEVLHLGAPIGLPAPEREDVAPRRLRLG